MGHQIKVILTPADTVELERGLKVLNIAVIPYVLPSRHLLLRPSMSVADMEREDLLVYLAREERLSQLQLRQLANDEGWTIDSRRSPVVEFSRCFFDENVLRQGRLFYEDRYFGTNGECVEKDKGFTDWARDLFRTVKKHLKRRADLSGYLGPQAEKWLSDKHGRSVAH